MSDRGEEEEEELHCRLCAEPTPRRQLIEAHSVVAANSKVKMKMSWINIDMSSSNHLPKAICFACFDMLEKTWSFLRSVREAQGRLHALYGKRAAGGEGEAAACRLADAGRPNADPDAPAGVKKHDVKLEVTIDTERSIDAATLLSLGVIKYEPMADVHSDAADGSAGDSRGSDSDLPLTLAVKKKKLVRSKKPKRRKKMKKKVKLKEVKLEELSDAPDPADLMPNPNAEAIPLDMSLYNMSWREYEWRCVKCDALCKDLPALRAHSLHAHKCCCVFKCVDCDKIMKHHKSFISHVRIHRKSLLYCCDICNKHFSLTGAVKKHRSREHADALRSCCQNCGATFDSQEQLQDHILNYAKGFRQRPYRKREKHDEELKCDYCDKEFKSKSNLAAHRLVHTERSRNFSCHICGKMFFTKGTLGTHMITHDDIKPYTCDYCPMAFRARGNLLSHASLHSGTKPFVCEQCGKSFRVKRHLKSHLIVHTDLMPFSCEYCGKPFRFKTRLNLHLRQHTGAKPYTCTHCLRDFTNGSNYKKHMKRRHNIDTGKRKLQEVGSEQQAAEIHIPFTPLIVDVQGNI